MQNSDSSLQDALFHNSLVEVLTEMAKNYMQQLRLARKGNSVINNDEMTGVKESKGIFITQVENNAVSC